MQHLTATSTNPSMLYILGGPGSGKGTVCERLVRDYGYSHISTGDIIREEIKKYINAINQNSKTPEGLQVEQIVAAGEMVSDELITGLLSKTMRERKAKKYLIDGFPRSVAQAKLLEQEIGEMKRVIYLDVDDEVLIQRIMGRALTSGRADDNMETVTNRIKVFKENTIPVVSYYKKFGRVSRIDASGDIATVYSLVQEAIKPKIFYIYGPPSPIIHSVASILSKVTSYPLLESDTKYEGSENESEMRVNDLIDVLTDTSEPNIIISNYFKSNDEQELFFQGFTVPYMTFHLMQEHSSVLQDLSKAYQCEKALEKATSEYNEYKKHNIAMLASIRQRLALHQINCSDTFSKVQEQVLEKLRPTIIAISSNSNTALKEDYLSILDLREDFQILRLNSLFQEEIERKTKLGNEMTEKCLNEQEVPISLKAQEVAQLLFRDLAKKKVILADFPLQKEEFQALTEIDIAVDRILHFAETVEEQSILQLDELTLEYYEKGKCIVIDKLDEAIIDTHLNRRAKWGLIIGVDGSGKTTIAKAIGAKYQGEVLEWEQFTSEVQQKLSTDEEPVEEVSFTSLIDQIRIKLDPLTYKKLLIMDGFPYDMDQAQLLIEKIGFPNFVIGIKKRTEQIRRIFMTKQEIAEDAELSEEQEEALNEIISKSESQSEFWKQLCYNNYLPHFFSLDGDTSLKQIQTNMDRIFQKRIFLIVDEVNEINSDEYRKYKDRCLTFAARHSTAFIDIRALSECDCKQKDDQKGIKESFLSPKALAEKIKMILSLVPQYTRDVMIYGLPKIPQNWNASEEQEKNSWRPSDYLYWLEETLGSIRLIAVLTANKINYMIPNLRQPLQRPDQTKGEKITTNPADDNEERTDMEEKQEEGTEDKVKAFSIYDFK